MCVRVCVCMCVSCTLLGDGWGKTRHNRGIQGKTPSLAHFITYKITRRHEWNQKTNWSCLPIRHRLLWQPLIPVDLWPFRRSDTCCVRSFRLERLRDSVLYHVVSYFSSFVRQLIQVRTGSRLASIPGAIPLHRPWPCSEAGCRSRHGRRLPLPRKRRFFAVGVCYAVAGGGSRGATGGRRSGPP